MRLAGQNRGPMREPASTEEAAFITDDLARLHEEHQRFLARLPQRGFSCADGVMTEETSGDIVVTTYGHRIEATHRPVFKDGRPWYMEYVFTVPVAGGPFELLRLALVRETLYDLSKPRQQLAKVNRAGLPDRQRCSVPQRLGCTGKG